MSNSKKTEDFDLDFNIEEIEQIIAPAISNVDIDLGDSTDHTDDPPDEDPINSPRPTGTLCDTYDSSVCGGIGSRITLRGACLRPSFVC
ncbi:MAG: hypothetical protein JNN15_03875 [Blastocatellia bacterium]|nr:hypothetical protein [Blastocatellia bacterium]